MGSAFARWLAWLIRPIEHRTPIEYARSNDRVKNDRKRGKKRG